MGYTSSNGTIKFNDYHFEDMTSAQRIKTATHELGHALGLDILMVQMILWNKES